jgi:aminoglycoside/choline kinase family phosphotransferase
LIGGLERLPRGGAGARALERLLSRLVEREGSAARLRDVSPLRRNRVWRLHLEVDGRPRSWIAKDVPPERARLERLVLERWLPRAELAGHAPTLLGVEAGPEGSRSWLVYEDLGERTLERCLDDPERVRDAARVVARLHRRFREHALLGECRTFGHDLGAAFFRGSVRDALRALRALGPGVLARRPGLPALWQRLVERLEALDAETAWRCEVLDALGGPETFLHGDLFPSNLVVVEGGGAGRIHLIDWDHAGVGPSMYDVSTFLLRLPSARRASALADYLGERGAWDGSAPGVGDWNLLFDTAERARLANGILWRALAGAEGAAWALDDLPDFDAWLAELGPVLPERSPRIVAGGHA